eukprot:PhF_6_TR43138/c0_g1_i1/m.66006
MKNTIWKKAVGMPLLNQRNNTSVRLMGQVLFQLKGSIQPLRKITDLHRHLLRSILVRETTEIHHKTTRKSLSKKLQIRIQTFLVKTTSVKETKSSPLTNRGSMTRVIQKAVTRVHQKWKCSHTEVIHMILKTIQHKAIVIYRRKGMPVKPQSSTPHRGQLKRTIILLLTLTNAYNTEIMMTNFTVNTVLTM